MPNVTYCKSQFTRKDYSKLYSYAPTGLGLKTLIHCAAYRDKRVQRALLTEAVKVLHAALEDIPLYINSKDEYARIIAQWRLSIGR